MKTIKLVLVILIIVFSGCAAIGFVEKSKLPVDVPNNNPTNPPINNPTPSDPIIDNPPVEEPIIAENENVVDIKKDENYGEEYTGIAFLTETKIDNFAKLDFSTKTTINGNQGTDYKLSLQGEKIKYEYTSEEGEDKEYLIDNMKNIKTIRMICNINGCSAIVALSKDNYIYYIPLDFSFPTEKSKNIIKGRIDGAVSLATYDSYDSLIVYDAMDHYLVVQLSDGTKKLVSITDDKKFKLYPLEAEQRKYLTAVGGFIDGVSVYNKDNFVNTFTYQKDKEGNNILIKLVLSIYLPRNNKNDEDSTASVIVLTNNNQLYYIEGSTKNDECVKFNDKIVENIKIKDKKIIFNYTDSTKEEYSFCDKLDFGY